jgi:hypothetical protein
MGIGEPLVNDSLFIDVGWAGQDSEVMRKVVLAFKLSDSHERLDGAIGR